MAQRERPPVSSLLSLIPAIVGVVLLSASVALGAPPAPPATAASSIDTLLEAENFAAAIPLLESEIRRLDGARSKVSPSTPAPEVARLDSLRLDRRSSLMVCHFQEGQYEKARVVQEKVIDLRKLGRAGDLQLADDWNDLGMICNQLADDDDAARAWGESVALLRRGDAATSAPKIVPRLSALAEAHRRLGQIAVADREMQEAIAFSAAQLPRDYRHARLLNNLGALRWDELQFDEASLLFREALQITEADSTSTPLRIAVAHHNLANLKREQGDTNEARRLHEKALLVARTHLTQEPEYPIFLKELAVLEASAGQPAKANSLWQEALAALAGSPREILASEIHVERGRAALERGDLVEAESSLREALAVRQRKRRADHPMVGQVHALLGELEMARGRAEEAERHWKRASEILIRSTLYREERIASSQGLARLAHRRGQRDLAIDLLRRSLDDTEALRAHHAASELSRTNWVARAAAPTQELIGWLVDEERVEEALVIGERTRGRVLRDQLGAAHVDVNGDIPPERRAALNRREKEALARIRGLRRDLELQLTRDEDSDVTKIENALDQALAALRDVQEETRVQSPSWSKALSGTPPSDLVRRFQAKLRPDEAALLYSVGTERSFVFGIPATGSPAAAEIVLSEETAAAWGVPAGRVSDALGERILADGHGPAPRIEAGVVRLRGTGRARPATPRAESPARPGSPSDAERLGNLLLPASIRSLALGAARLYVFPDGPVHDVPLEALAWTSPAGKRIDWIELGPLVVVAHSLSSLTESLALRASAPSPGQPASSNSAAAPGSASSPGPAASRRSLPPGSSVLSLCDPEVGSNSKSDLGSAPSALAAMAQTGRWKSLPGTRREADALRRAFAPLKTTRLVGKEAREGKLKQFASTARLLHLGTHGVVDENGSEMLAALLCASEPKGSAEDGFLHLFEIYEMELQAELVVLSACETMKGERVRGEGVFALSRGFFAAGAQRVVASLWPVDDDATAELMSRFFARYAETGDAAQALRDAKRAVRAEAKWADPFFWAPFVLSGSF